jgi:hypothetical protein
LTEDETDRLKAVAKHGSIIDALQMKAGVQSITEAQVQRPNRMVVEVEDVKASEEVYGEAANDEAAESFEVRLSAGRQIAITFDRNGEDMPRELLIEQQEDDLVVIAASQRSLDADAIVTMHEKSTTVEGNGAALSKETFNGTERIG